MQVPARDPSTPSRGAAPAAEGRAPARPGAYDAAFERAVRAVRSGRHAAPSEDAVPSPTAGSAPIRGVDELLSAIASPGRAEAASHAATTPVLAGAVARVALLVAQGASPAVSLQLGAGLEIRLEQARRGVEVEVRCLRGLSPLAEAELPGLLAALRARGVRVARGSVRGVPRALVVDAAPGLRYKGRRSGSVAKW